MALSVGLTHLLLDRTWTLRRIKPAMAIVVTSSVSPRLVAGKRVSAPRRAAAKVRYINSKETQAGCSRGRDLHDAADMEGDQPSQLGSARSLVR